MAIGFGKVMWLTRPYWSQTGLQETLTMVRETGEEPKTVLHCMATPWLLAHGSDGMMVSVHILDTLFVKKCNKSVNETKWMWKWIMITCFISQNHALDNLSKEWIEPGTMS